MVTTKSSNKSKQGAKKAEGLTSAFSMKDGSNKPSVVTSSNKKKDPRNQLFVEGFHPNFGLAYGKKFNKNHAMCGGWFCTLAEADETMQQEMGSIGVFPLRGPDGNFLPQEPGSLWPWKGTLFVVNEEKDGFEERRAFGDRKIAKWNELATTENCRFPRKMKFAKDLTGETLKKLDQGLLDEDVVRVMMSAYGHAMDLESMKDNNEIMDMFWTDVEQGKKAIDSFVLTMVNPDEQEEE